MGGGRVCRDKAVVVLLTWIILAAIKASLHETSAGTAHGI